MNNFYEKGLINHRSSLGFWLDRYGLKGTMVEVGVARGNFAREILSQWSGSRYVMVDPHEAQDPEQYREAQTNDWNIWKADCEAICKEDKRAELFTGYSADAAPMFANNSLSCCYVDANHSYAFVMQDMDLWWPKVKIGGILGGHDFGYQVENGAWIEVDRAVERWAKEHGVVF